MKSLTRRLKLWLIGKLTPNNSTKDIVVRIIETGKISSWEIQQVERCLDYIQAQKKEHVLENKLIQTMSAKDMDKLFRWYFQITQVMQIAFSLESIPTDKLPMDRTSVLLKTIKNNDCNSAFVGKEIMEPLKYGNNDEQV